VKRRESPISTPPVQTPPNPNYDVSQVFTGYVPQENYSQEMYSAETFPAESYPAENYAAESFTAESYPEVNSPVLISQSLQKMDLGQSPSPAMDSGIQVIYKNKNPLNFTRNCDFLHKMICKPFLSMTNLVNLHNLFFGAA